MYIATRCGELLILWLVMCPGRKGLYVVSDFSCCQHPLICMAFVLQSLLLSCRQQDGTLTLYHTNLLIYDNWSLPRLWTLLPVSHVFRAACSGSPQITNYPHLHVHVRVQAWILFEFLLCAEVLILYTENAQNSCPCIMWFDLMASMVTVFLEISPWWDFTLRPRLVRRQFEGG